MSSIQFCLFSSTGDIKQFGFIVELLTGSPEALCEMSVGLGYDGIEFLPDPLNIPDAIEFQKAMSKSGAVVPVVNTGRFASQEMPLLVADQTHRRTSVTAFKRTIEFAGQLDAKVGLGIARGVGLSGLGRAEMDTIAADVFHELAECAVQCGTTVMLEAAEPEVTSYINTMREVMAWVDRIGSPGFSAMLDTHQLAHAEPSVVSGIRETRGEATHIHLYDPSRWPPGVLEQKDRLDWQEIARVLHQEHFAGTASVVLAPEGDAEQHARTSLKFLHTLLREHSTWHADEIDRSQEGCKP